MSKITNTTTLVLDARTSRIIYFTALEPSCLPIIEGNLIVSVPTASLPADLDTVNSYQFTYKHGQITQDKPAAKAKPQRLIDANRAALTRQLSVRLRQQWDAVPPWLHDCLVGRAQEFQKVDDAYTTRIAAASEQSEIDVLAQEIAAIALK